MIFPNSEKSKKVDEILEMLNGYKYPDIEEILDAVADEANKYLTLNFKREVKDNAELKSCCIRGKV